MASVYQPEEERQAAMTPAASASWTPRLEPTMGNHALAKARDRSGPSTIYTSTSRLPTVAEAVEEIHGLVVFHPPERLDRLLALLQLLHGQIEDVKAEYKRAHDSDLVLELGALPPPAAARAKLIVERGEVALADKLFLGRDDVETLFRLLPKVRADAEAEADFAARYGDEFKGKGRELPDGTCSPSAVVAMLEDELSRADLDKAKALYTFGTLRGIDRIRIATNGLMSTDEDLLYEGLEQGMREAAGSKDELKRQFAAAYPGAGDLVELVESELSLGEERRALLILDGKAAEGAIELAVSGLGTDETAIFKALAGASDQERLRLYKRFVTGKAAAARSGAAQSAEDKDAVAFYERLAEDLNAADMRRVEALLQKGQQPDTAMSLLARAGVERDAPGVGDTLVTAFTDGTHPALALFEAVGVGYDELTRGGAVLDAVAIATADRDQLDVFRQAYDREPEFQQFVNQVLDDDEFESLRIMLQGSINERVELAIGSDRRWRLGTDEEYVLNVLTTATPTELRHVALDKTLMEDLRADLGTRDYNHALTLLRDPEAPVQERVAGTRDEIERERSVWMTWTTADWALRDDARAMNVTLERAKQDGQLSPEEQAAILKAEGETRGALESYKKARDELEEILAQVFTVAAGIIVGLVTMGAGTAVIVASQVARVAVISAVAQVLATKLARGDRFDMFGTDGATAFVSGAIGGATGLLTMGATNALAGRILPVASGALAETAEGTFRAAGKRLIAASLNGGLSAAPSGFLETAIDAGEMRGRIEEKITKIGTGTIKAVAMGTATGALTEGVVMGVETVRAQPASGGGRGPGAPGDGGGSGDGDGVGPQRDGIGPERVPRKPRSVGAAAAEAPTKQQLHNESIVRYVEDLARRADAAESAVQKLSLKTDKRAELLTQIQALKDRIDKLNREVWAPRLEGPPGQEREVVDGHDFRNNDLVGVNDALKAIERRTRPVPVPTPEVQSRIDEYLALLERLRDALNPPSGSQPADAADIRRELNGIESEAQAPMRPEPLEYLPEHIESLRRWRQDLETGRAVEIAPGRTAAARDAVARRYPCRSAEVRMPDGTGFAGKTYQEISGVLGPPQVGSGAGTGGGSDRPTTAAALIWRFPDGSMIRIDMPAPLVKGQGKKQVGMSRPYESGELPHLARIGPDGVHLSDSGVAVPMESTPAHIPIANSAHSRKGFFDDLALVSNER